MFYVVEFQTNGSTGANIVTSFTERNEAESEYHTKLAYASLSKVRVHGVMLVTEEMIVLKSEVYKHEKVN